MKNTINNKLTKLLFLPLFFLMVFTACQNELIEQTDPNEQQTIQANSSLASLIQNTATFDGSFDNILDSANCLAVSLPVTVIINGEEIVIEDEDDLDLIEDIFDEFEEDDDEVEIVFPITIILDDFTEVVINNYDELEEFADQCNGENEDDDDIECIDFQYPVSISVYDADFELIETIDVNSDEELYDLFDDLDDDFVASINFPVTMILADGSELVVNDNDELEAAIEAADDTCDEDDDNDYDDDDEDDEDEDECYEDTEIELCDEDGVVDGITTIDLFQAYADCAVTANVELKFYEELIDAEAGNENFIADPANYTNTQAYEQIVYLSVINLVDSSVANVLEVELNVENCNTSGCSEDDVNEFLVECVWNAVSFNDSDDLTDYDLDFMENGDLIISMGTDTYTGSWSVESAGDGSGDIVVVLGVPAPDIQAIDGAWLVVECDEDRLELHTDTTDTLVIERDCN